MENQFNHPESEKRISTTVGIVIIVLVAIIVGLLFWKSKDETESALSVPVVVSPIQVKKTVEAPSTETNTGNQAAADNTPVDFDKEMKDLDADVSAVNSTDFGDSGLSDANLGL